MITFLITFALSAILIKLIFKFSPYHAHLSNDSVRDGAQKYHVEVVPRIGGFAIFLSMLFTNSFYLMYHSKIINSTFASYLILSASIVFTAGFLEDIFKNVKPLTRMAFMVLATVVAIYWFRILPLVRFTGFNALDSLFHIQYIGYVLSVIITMVYIVGLTNAYNIIDGFHGVSTTTALLNLFGLWFIAHQLHDCNIMFAVQFLIAASLGFIIFNYPKGKIFLGDGGAYLIGFIIASLSIYLITMHHNSISPYPILLLSIYPITEIAFSMFRKRLLMGRPATQPDGLHLHMLIYKRSIPFKFSNRNSRVMPLSLFFVVPPFIVSLMFYKNTLICLSAVFVYLTFYVFSYFKIVRFKTPDFLQVVASHNNPNKWNIVKSPPEAACNVAKVKNPKQMPRHVTALCF